MEEKPILRALDIIQKAQQQILFYIRNLAEHVAFGKSEVPDVWLDDQDACRLLKVGTKTLSRRRKDGSLPYKQVKRKHYYKESDVHALLISPDSSTGQKKPGRKRKSKREGS